MNRHWDKIQEFTGENPDVRKFVFEKEDVCVEAVLYRYGSYEKRTVLCISVQSGCPVGCVFCGTGKQFIRNLTCEEITSQLDYIVTKVEQELGIDSLNARCEKYQVMFMSMGEPMLNWDNVKAAIKEIHRTERNAQLLISTIGIKDQEVWSDLCRLSMSIDKIGLQFSLHSGFDEERNKLIPFVNKWNIREIRDAGIMWNQCTGRPVYLNLCVDDQNLEAEEINRIMDVFSPAVFNFTFSVICEYENGKVKSELHKQFIMQRCEVIMTKFLTQGYNVRKFDPAGQEIGAGCGQLFYVQQWMKAR